MLASKVAPRNFPLKAHESLSWSEETWLLQGGQTGIGYYYCIDIVLLWTKCNRQRDSLGRKIRQICTGTDGSQFDYVVIPCRCQSVAICTERKICYLGLVSI